jgi:hypothetical protein
MARPKNIEIEDILLAALYREFDEARTKNTSAVGDYDAMIDLLDSIRTEKDYDWQSDVFIPEVASIILTECSTWAQQYFIGRDFVEVYLEKSGKPEVVACKAVKKLLNASLNNKQVFHFHKYIRARLINVLASSVYLLCRWEQKIEKIKVGVKQIPEEVLDEQGKPQIDEMTGAAQLNYREEDETEDKVIYDRFNYDVIDPANVFTGTKYSYSAQDTDFIDIREEVTYEDLKEKEKENGYINLNKVKELTPPIQTKTARESYDKGKSEENKKVSPYFDLVTRFGKHWAVVDARPTKISIGLDKDGEPKDNAELIETIISFVVKDNKKILIRFQPTPFYDGSGMTYRPLVRGLCYVHPRKNTGMSDGKYMRDLQVALNDTVNMSNDGVRMGTFPMMKINKFEMEDNDQLYLEPEHLLPLNDVKNLEQLKITTDVNAALQQATLFINKIQQVASVYPPQMGAQGKASETATAVQNAGSNANIRSNYKSLTVEYTLLTELYWQILQMAWQFMHPKTAEQIFEKDELMAFSPVGDYSYQPVTSAIEAEYSKKNKIQTWQQIMNTVVGIQHPDAVKMINFIFKETCQLMGKEQATFAETFLNEKIPIEQGNKKGANMQDEATSNQNGLPMQGGEQSAREGAPNQPMKG